MSLNIISPSLDLNLNGFYSQQLDANGIPIIGSSQVESDAFFAAAEIIGNVIINNRPLYDVFVTGIFKDFHISIIAEEEQITDLPEFSFLLNQSTADGRSFASLRGLGGYPASSAAEENILKYPSDPYRGQQSILLHEFAHAVDSAVFSSILPRSNLIDAYQNALAQQLWVGTYAITNENEYFAELTQVWFNDKPSVPAAGISNDINTRAELKVYDPMAYELMKSIYRDDTWQVGQFNGTNGNDQITDTINADYIITRGGEDLITLSGGLDVVYAGDEDDIIYISGAVELIDAGSGSDTADYLNSSSAITINLAELSEGIGGQGKFISVENISGSEIGNDVITGSLGDNILRGRNGDDKLNGLSGNDSLFGGLGNDVSNGGDGNDEIVDGLGDDTSFGGNGSDHIVMFSGANVIKGEADSDFLLGGAQTDEIFGGDGNDVLRGEMSNGFIGGSDELDGGAGNDILMGGAASDLFIFKPNYGVDTIAGFNVDDVTRGSDDIFTVNGKYADFVSGIDKIKLDGFLQTTTDDVLSFISQSAEGAVFEAEDTQIIFFGVDVADLNAGDFLIA